MLPRKTPPEKTLAKLNRWLMVALTPLQIVGNFVFLSIAYFLGVGFSALLYRLGPGRKKKRETSTGPVAGSYWREARSAPEDRDAWLRPF